jgi:hypothetical protein
VRNEERVLTKRLSLSLTPRLLQAFLTIVEVILVCFFGALLAHIVSFLFDPKIKGRERGIGEEEAWRRVEREKASVCSLCLFPRPNSFLSGNFTLAPETLGALDTYKISNKIKMET